MPNQHKKYTAEECANYAQNVLSKLPLDKLRKRILECFRENRLVGDENDATARCEQCQDFFALYRCNAPGECDCPKCQGYCKCHELEGWNGDEHV